MFRKASRYIAETEPELIVGLDLGTSKITVVVAERDINGDGAQIIGVGQAPSSGIRKGMIVNLDQAVRSVKQAVSDAQNMVGQEIKEVTVSFGGGEVTNIRSKGMVSLGRVARPVMSLDIERVIEAAQADVAVPWHAPAGWRWARHRHNPQPPCPRTTRVAPSRPGWPACC